MSNDNNKFNFSAYSSLFKHVKDSMFVRDNLSNKVSYLMEDNVGSNLEIFDEARLKNIVFEEIKERYTKRLNTYNLTNMMKIYDDDINSLEIHKFDLADGNNKKISGYFKVYPRAFYCKKCGDFKKVANMNDWTKFNPAKCSVPGCDGKYVQFPFVGFCEKCGNITDYYNICEHKDKYLKLIRTNPTSPSTWRLKCTKCGKVGDFLGYCKHFQFLKEDSEQNAMRVKVSNEPDSKYRPINVQQNSVSRSVVITTVDIPNHTNLNSVPYLDYISFGLHMGKFDKIKDLEYILQSIPLIINAIDIKNYSFEKYKSIFAVLKEEYIDDFDYFLNVLKELVLIEDLHTMREVNDYLILKGFFSNLQVNDDNLLNVVKFEDLDNYDGELKNKYETLKESVGLEDVFYVSDIHLISSSIGSIKGVNKIFDDNFVPHFQPHINSNTNNFKIYAYPFETEALMFDLDKIKLVKWLIDNEFLDAEYPEDDMEAKETLLGLQKNGEFEAYNQLKKLIHTFSHILIKKSSLYTGLQSDSCSELLFPSLGAFLIYSTSNIKIGGFLYVFENNLFDWFKDVKLDLDDCVFDPTCIDESGACFSCVYLPEFVCSEFNQDLDRDVFLGSTDRYIKGFWE